MRTSRRRWSVYTTCRSTTRPTRCRGRCGSPPDRIRRRSLPRRRLREPASGSITETRPAGSRFTNALTRSTASVISPIESGRHATSAKTLKRLAEALDARAVIGFEFSSNGRSKHELVALQGRPAPFLDFYCACSRSKTCWLLEPRADSIRTRPSNTSSSRNARMSFSCAR